MTIRIATASRNAACDAIVDRVDVGSAEAAGVLRVYSGSQPASAENAASGTLLAEVVLDDPAFGAASTGVATLAGVPLSTTGLPGAGTGTAAGWFRIVNKDEATVLDGSIGVSGSGADLIVNTATISENVDFEITSGTITVPAG